MPKPKLQSLKDYAADHHTNPVRVWRAIKRGDFGDKARLIDGHYQVLSTALLPDARRPGRKVRGALLADAAKKG